MIKLCCSPVLIYCSNISVTLSLFLLLDSRPGMACSTCWMGCTERKVQIYYYLRLIISILFELCLIFKKIISFVDFNDKINIIYLNTLINYS